MLPVALTTPYLSSAYPSCLVILTLSKLWIVNLPVNEYLFCFLYKKCSLVSRDSFRAAAFPLLGDPAGSHRADLRSISCRTQKVVAVLISLLGKSNQCKSSFFILNRGVNPLLFCFLFTKTSKVLHSSEGGLRESDRRMSEEEEGDDKGMVHLEVV